MILRAFKRMAGDSPDEVGSTLSAPEQLQLQQQLVQDAEQSIEYIAARHLGIHLKAAVFHRARDRRAHTIALVRHEGAPLTVASQRHALAGAILERYQIAARNQGLLPINQIVWCELHVAEVPQSCRPCAAEEIASFAPPPLCEVSKRPP